MSRGDLVTVAYGKPRPALIVQADAFGETSMVAVLLLTSTLTEASLMRHTVMPDAVNNLQRPSQIEIDRVVSVDRRDIGKSVGRLDDATLLAVDRLLATFLGIGER